MSEHITIDPKDTYTRRYSMRRVTLRGDTRTVVSTVPLDVVARAARKRGLGVVDFIEQYDIEYLYNGVEGAFMHFVRKDSPSERVMATHE